MGRYRLGILVPRPSASLAFRSRIVRANSYREGRANDLQLPAKTKVDSGEPMAESDVDMIPLEHGGVS